MNTIWLKIQETLRSTTNPGVYDVWLKHLQGSYAEGTLSLKAPSAFAANFISNRMRDALLQAAESVLGERPVLQIEAQPAAPLTRKPVPAPLVTYCVSGSVQAELPIEQKPHLISPQRWRFSFNDFVVGPSNQLAYAAAKSVCDKTLPSDYVFISSKPGLGKTHLLHAVGSELCKNASGRTPRVAYLSSEEFARQMVSALRTRNIESFKAKFRDNIDLLLLEDVHFFQGKESMQDELLATLNCLKLNGSKVVFTSSFMPKEIMKLDPQLASRFCSGFLALINTPDMETRRRIIEQKAKSFQVQLPENVTELLADRMVADIRQLESCLQNLVLKARLLNQHISLDMAWEIVEQYTVPETRCTVERIIEFICSSFELSPQQLKSKSRQRQIVLARNMAFFMARHHTELSLKDIGDRFNRKHSTVLKGIANVEREMNLDTPLGRQLSSTMKMIDRFSSAS